MGIQILQILRDDAPLKSDGFRGIRWRAARRDWDERVISVVAVTVGLTVVATVAILIGMT